MLVPWRAVTALSCYASLALGFSASARVGSLSNRYNGCTCTYSSAHRTLSSRLQYARVVRGGCHQTNEHDDNGYGVFRSSQTTATSTRSTQNQAQRAVALRNIETESGNGEKDGEVEAKEKEKQDGGWGDESALNDDVSFGRMLRFILPTLGIWLASPILSLVDAGVVGTRSALELASLGPATVLCESLIYCSTFLAIATTNLQATALADGKQGEAQKVVAQALGLALSIGVLCTLVVQVSAPRVLIHLAGEKSKEVLPAALTYSRVRILGAPASIGAMVLQAACLGARDSVTPLGVVLVAGLINATGDWLTVCRLNMGVFGAGAATAVAELVSMILLGVAVWRAQGKRLHKFIELPSWEELKIFLDFAGPIAFALMGKVVCYSSMTLACTALGTIPLATHNVMLRVFFFFATFGEALSQTAQAFIPGQLARERSSLKAARAISEDSTTALDTFAGGSTHTSGLSPARRLMRKVLVLGVGVGSLNAFVAGLVPLHLPHLFTNSAGVTAGMRSLIPLLSWSLLTHACVMGLEGILLARRRLRFLAGCYAVNTVVMVGFMQYVKTWSPARGLQGAWLGLLLLQLLRVAEFGMHLLWLNRHERVEGRQMSPI